MDNKPEQIHETALRDAIDAFDMIKDEIENIKKTTGEDSTIKALITKLKKNGSNSAKNFKSIADASSNLTLVFPVLCSRGLDINTSAMISKAIERKCVTMLQMVLSAKQLDDSLDAFEFIKKFHTNLSLNAANIDDVIEVSDRIAAHFESATSLESIKESAAFNEAVRAVEYDVKHNLNYYLSGSVSESALTSFKVENSKDGFRIIKEANDDDTRDYMTADKYFRDKEKHDHENDKFSRDKDSSDGKNYMDADKFFRDKEKHGLDVDSKIQQNAIEKERLAIDIARNDRASSHEPISVRKDMSDVFKNQVLDSDIKKANELMPTMMVVSYKLASPGEDGKIAVTTMENIVIGVKAKLYALDSEDIVSRMSLKAKDKNVITQLIRVSTREISFWKDFVFAIDKAKIDALSQSRKGSSSKLWKVLERRGYKSRMRRQSNKLNDATAISTLVLSQQEVEYMKKSENLDLESLTVIRPIMESYNLMGVCIVDETMEVAKFLFDTGDDVWETVSFSHLERETSDGTYKKVVNLMSRIR